MSNQPPYSDPNVGSQYPTNPSNPQYPQYPPQSPEYPSQQGYPQQPGYGAQPGGYPQPGYGYPPAQPQGGAGFGIASLIFGILSIVLFFLTVLDIVPIALGIILGIIGRGRNRRGRGMALAGIITSVIGLIIVVGVFVAAAAFINNNPNILNTATP